MPTYTPYPGPGKGIAIQGLNKNGGWGSYSAAGQLVRVGDYGINKTAGKSLEGLDQRSNPVVTSSNVTGITATAANVVWTTNVARPLGSLRYRKASSGAWTTVPEAGTPPLTNHTIGLTGLTAGTTYEYEVTQPATGGVAVGKQVYEGRFTTAAAGGLGEGDGFAQGRSTGVDGVGAAAPAPTPSTQPGDLSAMSAASPDAAGALTISGVQVTENDANSLTVTWRTDVYATGRIGYRASGDPAPLTEVDEEGSKRMNHTMTLTALRPGTTYQIGIRSTDSAGNSATAGPVEATTPAA